MDDVIGRLLEVDRQARKRVSKARKAGVKSVAALDEKREALQAKNDGIFNERIEELKASQAEFVRERSKEISSENEAALELLEKKAEAHSGEWIEEIVRRVTED